MECRRKCKVLQEEQIPFLQLQDSREISSREILCEGIEDWISKDLRISFSTLVIDENIHRGVDWHFDILAEKEIDLLNSSFWLRVFQYSQLKGSRVNESVEDCS